MKNAKTTRLALSILFSMVLGVLSLSAPEGDASARPKGLWPSAGDELYSGQVALLRWNERTFNSDVKFVRLMLWDGRLSRWTVIADGIPANQQEFSWAVPANINGDRFRLRVDDMEAGSVVLTGSYFKINAKPLLSSVNHELKTMVSPWSIAPNPASKTITVSWSGPVQKLEIRNLLGQTLGSITAIDGQASAQFGTSTLPNGTYIIILERIDGTIDTKQIQIVH